MLATVAPMTPRTAKRRVKWRGYQLWRGPKIVGDVYLDTFGNWTWRTTTGQHGSVVSESFARRALLAAVRKGTKR